MQKFLYVWSYLILNTTRSSKSTEKHWKLSTKGLMFLNCGVGEDSWQFHGLQGVKPVNPKGNQSWIFIGWTDAEAETPILWPPDVKNWLIRKAPNAGQDWRQEENGMTEDEIVWWHHWPDGWIWASSGSWWLTGKPGVLQSIGSQRVKHDWATELNWLCHKLELFSIYRFYGDFSIKVWWRLVKFADSPKVKVQSYS